MIHHELDIRGKVWVHRLTTKPVWSAADEGRMIYVEADDTFYYASGTAWVPDHKFKSILVSGQDSIVADNPEDNLTFVNGNGIAITTDATTDTITFTVVDSEIDHGTISGLDGDDHTQYYNTARHTKLVHDALAIDHGSLSGRGDDDHSIYYNAARHTKLVHDALNIDADTLDTYHATKFGSSLATSGTNIQLKNPAGTVLSTVSGGLASGTVLWFWQAAAPTGWTIVDNSSDTLLAIKGTSGAYNVTPGSSAYGTWTQTSHTHTGPNHTHTVGNHRHTGPNHRHTGPSHTHTGSNHTHTYNTVIAHTHDMLVSYGESPAGVWRPKMIPEYNIGGYVTESTGSASGTTAAGGTGATGAGGTGWSAYNGTGATSSAGATTSSAAGTGSTSSAATAATYRPYARVGILAKKD